MGDNGGRLQGRQRDAPALSHLQSYPMLVGLQITLGLSRHSSPGRALLPEQGPRGRVESQTLCVERGQAGVVLQWQLTMRSRFCVCGIAIGGCGRAAGGLRAGPGRAADVYELLTLPSRDASQHSVGPTGALATACARAVASRTAWADGALPRRTRLASGST